MDNVTLVHNASTPDDSNDDGGNTMDTQAIVYISAEVINGVISVLGNSVVLAAILRTPRLHTVTNVFIVSLALADVVVGFLVAPAAVSVYKSFPVDFYICVLINTFILMFTNISILMLLAVAVERFIAINKPFIYARVMTVRRAVLVNVLVWLLGIFLGLVPIYGWHKDPDGYTKCQFTQVISYEYMTYFQFFALVLLPLFIMLVIYIYILRVVHYHSKRDKQHNTLFLGDNHRTTSKQRREWNKDVKAAKYFALIILLFAIFWLPVNILNMISLFWPEKMPPIQVLLVAIVLSHANSSINPFLYAASNSRIKRAMKTTLHIRQSDEDTENTDYQRDQRVSSAGHGERDVISGRNRSINQVMGVDNLALTYPVPAGAMKTSIMAEKGVDDDQPESAQLHTTSPTSDRTGEVRSLAKSNTDEYALQNQRLETQSLSGQGIDQTDHSQPTNKTNVFSSSPKQQHKNILNSYLKFNQVHPIQSQEKTSGEFMKKKQDQTADSNDCAINMFIKGNAGYHNPAFMPDEILVDCERDATISNRNGNIEDECVISKIPRETELLCEAPPATESDSDNATTETACQSRNGVSDDTLSYPSQTVGYSEIDDPMEPSNYGEEISIALKQLHDITELEDTPSSLPLDTNSWESESILLDDTEHGNAPTTSKPQTTSVEDCESTFSEELAIDDSEINLSKVEIEGRKDIVKHKVDRNVATLTPEVQIVNNHLLINSSTESTKL